MLDNQEIEAIRKRAETATPGLWFTDSFGDVCSKVPNTDTGGFTFEFIACDILTEMDAEFIAHAREDIPKLLSFVEYQQAEIERLRQEKDEWYKKSMKLDAIVSMQYSLLQRYEKALQKILDKALSDAIKK